MKLPACTGKMLRTCNSIKGGVFSGLKKRSELRYSKNFLHLFGIVMASAGIVVGVYATLTNWIIPMVRALSETTKAMPSDLAFNATGYASGSGVIVALSNEVRIATSSTWVNGAFLAKKTLTINNLSGQTLSATGSASVTINTKELYDAGKLQADCDDLRVAFVASASGNTRTEISRSFQIASGATNCSDSIATIVTFPRQEQLWVGQSTSNYEIYYSDATAVTPVWPKEKYVSLDGSSDMVVIPYYSPNDDSFTVAAWFKMDSSVAGSSSTQSIFGNNQWTAFLGYTPNTKTFHHLRQWNTGSEVEYWTTTPNYADSQWHHVALVVDRTNLIATLYVDGVSLGNQAMSGNENYEQSNGFLYTLGKSYSTSYFTGQLDEAKIYREALSPSDILTIKDEIGVTSEVSKNSSLLAYYSLNEGTGQTVTDGSGNGRHGTLGANSSVSTDDPSWMTGGSQSYSLGNKMATLVCPFNGTTTCNGGVLPTTATGAIRFGGGKTVLGFDGYDDKVSVADNDSLDMGTGGLSVSTWIKVPVFSGNARVIAYKGGASAGNIGYWWQVRNSGKLQLNVSDGTNMIVSNFVGTANVMDNNWHHVAFTWNPTSGAKMYVDGNEDASFPVSTSANISNTYPLIIGSYSSTGYTLKGYIDNLSLYKRELVSNEISSLYNSGLGKEVEASSDTKLILNFDEYGDDPRNTGKAIDASGNNNHGTITGAVYVGGLVGSELSTSETGFYSLQNYFGHQGTFVEEATTNLITNPSFEHSTFNTNWSPSAFTYATASATFTAGMAKRNVVAAPFAAGVVVQGPLPSSSSVSDNARWSIGNLIGSSFYQLFDNDQGSAVLWVTPEWNGTDAGQNDILGGPSSGGFRLYKNNSRLYFRDSNNGVNFSEDISSWTAGQTKMIVVRWDKDATINGTHYMSMSIDDVSTFGGTNQLNMDVTWQFDLGNYYSMRPANAIIEGLTVYRRVLFDGIYGTNVGNGDEISLMYNSGLGKDPTSVTGTWDVVFALPTNSSTGSLSTGTGNAWSMPHTSNLLGGVNGKNGFMMSGDFSTDGWTASAAVVSNLATSSKIYSGGYAVESGPGNGIYRDISVTPGQDLVIRGVTHSDGTSVPQVYLYDLSNGAQINYLNGTTSSTKASPNVLLFTAEVPANCTSVRVLLTNSSASTATVNWHQLEIYNNKVNNPSLEGGTGDPWIPTGWTNYNAEVGDVANDAVSAHSGSSSVKIQNDTSAEGLYVSGAHDANKYFGWGAWAKEASGILRVQSGAASTRSNDGSQATWPYYEIDGNTWQHYKGAGYASAADRLFLFGSSGSGNSGNVDDVYVISLDDVSLTITSSSHANSTEVSGVRVDGVDVLSQPISGMSPTRGAARFKFTPRHSSATAGIFSKYSPEFVSFFGPNNDYIYADVPNATTVRVGGNFNGVYTAGTGTYSFSANTTYLIEISYQVGGRLVLKINGSEAASVAMPGAFTADLTTVYFGSWSNNPDYVFDGTFTSFVTAQATENTTTPYIKFGSKSAKIVAYDSADEYITTATVSANTRNTISAFVFNGSSGVIGGPVDSSVATLASGSATVSTTYTDFGGGWWRLSYTDPSNIPADTYKWGVQVKPGKTIYVDGVQVESKTNISTYTDGSLGSGYTWSGTANLSTSTRSVATLIYQPSSMNPVRGTISMWFKPDWDTTDIRARYFGNRGAGVGDTWMFYKRDDGSFRFYPNTQDSSSRFVNSSVPNSTQIARNKWAHITVTYDQPLDTLKMYLNGVDVTTTNAGSGWVLPDLSGGIQIGSSLSSVISDFRIYDQALSGSEVAELYYGSVSTHNEGTESDDRYESGTKTYTSPVMDLSANGQWGQTPWSATTVLNGGTVSYFTRSSADNNTWSDWEAVSGSTIASDPRRYFQWKADMTASAGLNSSPVIRGMQLAYVEDSTAPVNPTEVALGFSTSSTPSADLTSGSWYNFATPKFTWDAGVDEAENGQSASGIDGYHMLFTKDASASPSSSVASACYKYAEEGSRTFTVGTSPSGCVLTDGVWYLRTQVKDNSGNTSSPVTLFTYKYDGSIPNAPISLSSTTVGYSANNTFGFYWPAGVDNGPAGVSGYEYKTGAADGEYSTWQFTTATSVENIPAYKEGQNFIYVRTVDVAGNASGIASNNLTIASFYYNASAPTAPQNISISPNTTEDNQSTSNVFTVTWDRPASFSGEIAKYHYCVNCTPSANNMTETTAAETVNRTLTNVSLANQQGRNTLYIVAEDNNMNVDTGHGNRNFSAYATADFYAETVAPSAPTNLSLNDASDRDASLWRLSLTWKNATGGGEVAKYQVYRSLNNEDYVKLGETTSTAYTDADLEQSTKYFYKVRAVDNANATSLFSSVVYRSPEGKYTTPPTIGGVPVVTPGSTTAIVKWTTGRVAYGTVEYGKTVSYGAATTESVMTADHAIKITGLAPGVTYHFRTQSLDDSAMTDYDREAAYSASYTFTTLNSAAISTVTVEEAGLTSAVISWQTSSLATSTIEYGETKDYGLSQEVTTSASASAHIARLTNLKHSTTYNFRVRGVTSDGDDIFSENYELSTLLFPKVTAVVLNTDQGAGGASVVLAWATNVPTTGEIEYQGLKPEGNIGLPDLQNMSQTNLASVSATPEGKSQIAYSGKMEVKHLMRLDGLKDGMIYVFTIRGRDEYGNQAISDPIRYVTGEDTRAPVISNIVIETPLSGNGGEAKASAIISWETDEPSIGQVLWGVGTGSEYGNKSEMDAMPTTKHTVVLRDLTPTTSYHLKIESRDVTGNLSASQDTVVVTPTSQQAALDIVLKNLEDVFGFLRW